MKYASLFIVPCFLLTACAAGTENPAQETVYDTPGTRADASHGQETNFAIGAMAGIGGRTANGVAMMRTFHDGTSVVTVRLNITAAEDGSRYEGRLTSSDPKDTREMGRFAQPLGDSWHELQFETASLSQKTGFTITAFSVKGEGENRVETAVAEGVLKGVAR